MANGCKKTLELLGFLYPKYALTRYTISSIVFERNIVHKNACDDFAIGRPSIFVNNCKHGSHYFSKPSV